MGWFEDGEGRVLGDTPLDETRRYLLALAAHYIDAMQRPPTVQELQQTLSLVLSGCDNDIALGLDEQMVTAVRLKMKKRPKKQHWNTGDSFCRPLRGWLLRLRPHRLETPAQEKGAGMIEIFRYRSRAPVFHAAVAAAGRLFSPVHVNGLVAFEEGRWRIVGHDSDFRADDHDDIRFYMGSGDEVDLFTVEYKCVARNLPISEVPAHASNKADYSGGFPEETERRLAKLEQRVLDELTTAGIGMDTTSPR